MVVVAGLVQVSFGTFVTERAARRLYPDAVGDRKLFDRQRVADIVNGNF